MKKLSKGFIYLISIPTAVIIGLLGTNVEAGRILAADSENDPGAAYGLGFNEQATQPEPSKDDDLSGPASAPTNNIDTPPPGNSLYKTQDPASPCISLSRTNQAFSPIFPDFTVTTKAVTGLMEISVSSVASIGSRSAAPLSTADAFLYFRCQISADGGSSWSDCSGMGTFAGSEGILWVRRNRSFDNGNVVWWTNTVPGSYIGFYPNTLPNTTYTIRLQARHTSIDATSTVCFANAIVRY